MLEVVFIFVTSVLISSIRAFLFLLSLLSSRAVFFLWCKQSETLNLYGVHPFYLNVEKSGNANGVFFLNSNPMGEFFGFCGTVVPAFVVPVDAILS